MSLTQRIPAVFRPLGAAVSAILIAGAGFGCGEKSEPAVSSVGTGATVPTATAPTTPPATTTAPAPAPAPKP